MIRGRRGVRPVALAAAVALLAVVTGGPVRGQSAANGPTLFTEASPWQVRLEWPAESLSSRVVRVQRARGDGQWQLLAEVPGALGAYVDSEVAPGEHLAYRLDQVLQTESGIARGGEAAVPLSLLLPGSGKLVLVADQSVDRNWNDHAIWANPRLLRADGSSVSLTSLKPEFVQVGYGDPQPPGPRSVGGSEYLDSIWAHAPSRLVYRVDAAFAAFETRVGIDASQGERGSVRFIVQFEPDQPVLATAEVTTPQLVASPGHTAYYVDSVLGHDRASGTGPEQAWRTLERASRMRFAAADRVLLRAGNTYAGQLAVSGAGAAREPVVIEAYGKGPEPVVDAAGRCPYAVRLYRAQHVRLQGIAITDSEAPLRDGRAAVTIEVDDPHALATLSLSAVPFQQNPKVLGERSRMAAVMVRAIGRPFDYSAYERVALALVNRSASVLHVEGYVANAGSDGNTDACWGVTELTPRTRGALAIRLVCRPENAQAEIDAQPYFKGGTRHLYERAGSVDPAAIVEIGCMVDGAVGATLDFAGVTTQGTGTGTAAPAPFFPFIDSYGQYVHRDWPKKVHSDEDLRGRIGPELAELRAMPDVPDRDQYGGWAKGPQLTATGRFRADKWQGKWYLVDPEGRLFFSFGPTGVGYGDSTYLGGREKWFADLPDPKGPLAAAYWTNPRAPSYAPDDGRTFNFVRANILRKYGPGPKWATRNAEMQRLRLRKFGLNTIANWSDSDIYLGAKIPYVVAIHTWARLIREQWPAFPDVFDPGWAQVAEEQIKGAAAKTADDPWCLGYFVDNEIGWGWDTVSLAVDALQGPADLAAKQTFVTDLQQKYGAIERLNAAWGTKYASWQALLESRDAPLEAAKPDLETFVGHIVEHYFSTIRRLVKQYAPDTLYLGPRIAGWANDIALAGMAKYCDVASFNIYAQSGRVDGVKHPFDKPYIIGEFGYWDAGASPWNDRGAPERLETRQEMLTTYVESALRNPQIVGCHFFQYHDQPISGRPDGECTPIGFVDLADSRHDDVFNTARQLAEKMYQYRAER